MSRFAGTDLHDPGYDMRSHQAPHRGARQDRSNRLFSDYVKQVRWWVSQFGYLVEQLGPRPEGSGTTLLDHPWCCSARRSPTATLHSHQDMPFVLAGRRRMRAPGRDELRRPPPRLTCWPPSPRPWARTSTPGRPHRGAARTVG
ncbi:MAG: hypothetical protein IPN17_08070 [Deltaproteobacteria bacterium]|nr:hypothetical protein [Deltaproteobacteria bacterium]